MMPVFSASLSVQGRRHLIHSGARIPLHMHEGALERTGLWLLPCIFCLKILTLNTVTTTQMVQQEATDVQKDCVVTDLGSSSDFITKYISSFRQLSLSDFCCL